MKTTAAVTNKSSATAQLDGLSAEQTTPTPHAAYDAWHLLGLLNLFRGVIAGGFCLLYFSGKLLSPLGSQNPRLFFQTSLLYVFLSLVLWIFIRQRRINFIQQVYIAAGIDILLVTLLMHSSGGIESGLAVLLVITIGASSMLLSQRSTLALAAAATLMLLGYETYNGITSHKAASYPIAGLLGFIYFTSALLVHWLAHRIRETEALAQRRGIDLANLAQLTQHIIQRMQTGVMVIDQYSSVRLINEAAQQMLGFKTAGNDTPLYQLSPELAEQWQLWQNDHDYAPSAIPLRQLHIDILPRFALIGDSAAAGALIFLQDMAALAQQAQQLQLASLGRLTASIAHEIRNPLGAISHAGQLLAESTHLDKHDQRLTRIILDHSHRLNTIVENVMSVSRRRPSQIELLRLDEFLQRFVSDYTTGKNIARETLDISIEPADLQIRFDTSHLQQILVNLCDNGLRHSGHQTELPLVTLQAGFDHSATRPHLDVIDRGPGVSTVALPHLFEPFFTTETTGTGLGLYLSRELAEANQAHLSYIGRSGIAGIFRITFQDPRRQFE